MHCVATGRLSEHKMPKDKGPEWNHVLVDDAAASSATNLALTRMQCLYCDKVFTGGVNRIRTHLAGDSTAIGKCSKAPDAVVAEMLAANKERARTELLKKKKVLLDNATKTPSASGCTTDVTSKKQTTITAVMQNQSKQLTDAAVARAFYATGMAFSIADNKYFKDAIHAIARAGPSYNPPNRQALAGKLLSDEVAQVDGKLSEFKTQLATQGGTLVSDGWTNVQNRPIINFLVVTADGAMFVDGVDTSGQVKDADFIAEELGKRIESLGPENVVQVVTDSAGNCVAAREKLAGKYKSIVFSPCAAHCLDLLLEDIGKLAWVKDVIAEGHDIVKFITNHQSSLAYFRTHSELELLKPGETRFASYFIMLNRLKETQDALQETVMDREYKQWLARPGRKKSIKICGDAVTKNVVDPHFWNRVAQVTSVCEPIVCLLRMVDGCIPCVGKIYWHMYKLDQNILTSASLDPAQKNTLSCMINNRWKMLHTDLHSAGFVLDPEYRAFLQHENEEVISGFHAMIERVHAGDVAAQVRAIEQHSVYRAGQGLFARPVAMAASKEMPASRWWMAFGAHIPELQKVAVRVLSQVASASACERNWSTFDFIHTKKRNRLQCDKVNKILFFSNKTWAR